MQSLTEVEITTEGGKELTALIGHLIGFYGNIVLTGKFLQQQPNFGESIQN